MKYVDENIKLTMTDKYETSIEELSVIYDLSPINKVVKVETDDIFALDKCKFEELVEVDDVLTVEEYETEERDIKLVRILDEEGNFADLVINIGEE